MVRQWGEGLVGRSAVEDGDVDDDGDADAVGPGNGGNLFQEGAAGGG